MAQMMLNQPNSRKIYSIFWQCIKGEYRFESLIFARIIFFALVVQFWPVPSRASLNTLFYWFKRYVSFQLAKVLCPICRRYFLLHSKSNILKINANDVHLYERKKGNLHANIFFFVSMPIIISEE